MLEFNTPFNRKKDLPEKNSGKIIVEKAGYVPAKTQIENLMRSGEALLAYRKGLYNGYEGETDEEVFENHDPTNDVGFDVINAQQLLKSENERLTAKYGSDNSKDGVKKVETEKVETEITETEKVEG